MVDNFDRIKEFLSFDKCKESIINECNQKKARAYIDVNAKDIKKVALLALKQTAALIYDGHHEAVRKVYDWATGNVGCKGKKLWLIDIDTKENDTIHKIFTQLAELGAEVQLQLPSHSGVHILTTPFNTSKFVAIENVDIIKHGLTLLYKPSDACIFTLNVYDRV